ncbi:MAG TPA: cation:proton antiporter [Thermoanaerobaculia bacterium]|jgi:Kef-type K+ transport system membrane component KefB|nr:cation:proton antiporter [Thermoanaerobaculia bacterium]
MGAVLLGLVLMLAAGKLGGWAAERVRQPPVLGELLAGVVLGNLALVGAEWLGFLSVNEGLRTLAELGVIILLFQVGLESDAGALLSVGWSSLLVACLGVVAPFLLGWGVSAWLLPEADTLVHIFIGATLCATSVGITARVLADLGKLQAPESRIILGAAVIDDVLGLVILAVVIGSIAAADRGAELHATSVLWIIGKAALFLFGSLAAGGWVSRHLFAIASRLQIRGTLLAGSLSVAFFFAWLADLVGLAPIVGAFAAGLILDEVHYRDLVDRSEHDLEELLLPIAGFLVPLFFVHMGLAVDLRSFADVRALGLAALLLVAAVLGKLACAGGVLGRGLDRLSVAVGMVPRGEVGLIFAGIGAQLMLRGERVVSPAIFSALVIVVIATTVVTPPLLLRMLARGDRRKALAIVEQNGGPGERLRAE